MQNSSLQKTKIIWGENDKETKMYMARKLNKIINKGKEQTKDELD